VPLDTQTEATRDVLTSRHLDATLGYMRTTVRIDDDLLDAARSLASQQDAPLGQVISDLIRRGIRSMSTIPPSEDGFPVFQIPESARPISLSTVRMAEEETG